MDSYRVKVRTETYIWGGAMVDYGLEASLMLLLRVDDTGEPIAFGISRSNPIRQTYLGTLAPGEAFAIPLNGISGVYAQCQFDTFVTCSIIEGENGRLTRPAER